MKSDNAKSEIACDLRFGNDDSRMKIGRDLSLHEAMVWTILKKSGEYKEHSKVTLSSLSFSRNRELLRVEMEHLLLLSIKDCDKKENSSEFC